MMWFNAEMVHYLSGSMLKRFRSEECLMAKVWTFGAVMCQHYSWKCNAFAFSQLLDVFGGFLRKQTK